MKLATPESEKYLLIGMMLESQSAINPHHKLRPIKPDQPLIDWIKFITPSSFFGPSLEYSVLELAQIS